MPKPSPFTPAYDSPRSLAQFLAAALRDLAALALALAVLGFICLELGVTF